ncbi:hypothetical protein GH733_010137, partial [Mirounga leonina]
MFQIGGLIVFCGLLGQTTALLDTLPLPLDQTLLLDGTPAQDLSPTDLAGSLTDALSNGLLSEGLLGILENLPLLNILKTGGGTSGGLLEGLLGKVISVVPLLNNIIDIKITNAQLLELGLVQSSEGHRLYVTIPLGINLNVNTLVNSLGSVLNEVLPELVQGEVCPLVNGVLSQLDVTLVHSIA